jgi:GNAT superfamily N-acetyltransferase
MTERNVIVRKVDVADAAEVAQLSAELGYPLSEAELADRLRHYHDDPLHHVFVAEVDTRVVGWVDVGIVCHLVSGPYGEIGGLVVTSDLRGLGIGKRLMEEAEKWALARGVSRCVVRSRSTRLDTHRFYQREGWTLEKTSAVFRKTLEPT